MLLIFLIATSGGLQRGCPQCGRFLSPKDPRQTVQVNRGVTRYDVTFIYLRGFVVTVENNHLLHD